MKSITTISTLVLALTLLCSLAIHFNSAMAGPKPKAAEGGGINWMSLTQAEKLNENVGKKGKQKKIFIDIYTDWCGWCKRLDATTYQDPKVVKYINDNFYAVKLNAETKDTISFKGIKYAYDPNNKVNMVSPQFLGQSPGYPTLTYLDENLRVLRIAPGYVDVNALLNQLKFVGENYYLNMSYAEYNNKIAGKTSGSGQ